MDTSGRDRCTTSSVRFWREELPSERLLYSLFVFVAPACCAGLSISPALDTFLKERTREQSKAYNYKRAPEQMAVRRAKKQLKAKRKEDVRTEAGGYNTGAYGV